MTSDILVVATSAAPARDYRVEFLNAFAYPDGHHVFFRYRPKWISGDLRADLPALKGRQALLVFCEDVAAHQHFTFHPVRYCKVVDVHSPADGGLEGENDRVVLRLELGAFVNPAMLRDGSHYRAFQQMMLGQDGHPYPSRSPNAAEDKWVFNRTLPEHFGPTTGGEWHQIALSISKGAGLEDSCFMHIRQIRETRRRIWRPDAETHNVVKAISRPYGLVYQLQYDRSYMLELEYMIGDDRSLRTPSIEPPAASVSMPFRRFLPNAIITDLLLSPAGASDSRCGLLVPSEPDKPDPQGRVPRAVLMLEIKGRRVRIILHTVVIGVGLLLSTFSPQLQPIVAALFGMPEHAEWIGIGLKAAGILLSSVGILFGLRQLPSFPT